jgi:hypothetical protein
MEIGLRPVFLRPAAGRHQALDTVRHIASESIHVPACSTLDFLA